MRFQAGWTPSQDKNSIHFQRWYQERGTTMMKKRSHSTKCLEILTLNISRKHSQHHQSQVVQVIKKSYHGRLWLLYWVAFTISSLMVAINNSCDQHSGVSLQWSCSQTVFRYCSQQWSWYTPWYLSTGAERVTRWHQWSMCSHSSVSTLSVSWDCD